MNDALCRDRERECAGEGEMIELLSAWIKALFNFCAVDPELW